MSVSLSRPVDPSASSPARSPAAPRPRPFAVTAAAVLGIAWNVFGIVQWVQTLQATPASLTAWGLSASQAAAYLAVAAWLNTAFAVGVFAGLAGTVGLLLRRRWSVGLLALSLVGYVGLAAGDVYSGLFEAMPRQMAVIAFVVAVAVGLWAVARRMHRAGDLR